MKALIILALVVLISYSTQDDGIPSLSLSSNYQCPDDKIKLGDDVCAITSSQHGSANTDYITYIKKKSCGKNKWCIPAASNYNKDTDENVVTGGDGEDVIFNCQKRVRLLKIDKKCNYNAECYTGFCNNNHKCAPYGDYECAYNRNCGPDKFCDFSSGKGKCKAFIQESKDCSNAPFGCAPGFGCYTKDSTTYTCQKYFSLDKGVTTNDKIFCKSGFSTGTCAEIVEVASDCKLTYNDGGSANKEIPATSNGDTYDGNKFCYIKSGYKDLVSDLVKRYNKIKLDKLLDKENCDYGYEDDDSDPTDYSDSKFHFLCDKKFAELYSVYTNYMSLLYHSLIKENGEKNKDKKCEYEFWRTVTVSSSYVNVYLGFAFALLGLLL